MNALPAVAASSERRWSLRLFRVEVRTKLGSGDLPVRRALDLNAPFRRYLLPVGFEHLVNRRLRLADGAGQAGLSLEVSDRLSKGGYA